MVKRGLVGGMATAGMIAATSIALSGCGAPVNDKAAARADLRAFASTIDSIMHPCSVSYPKAAASFQARLAGDGTSAQAVSDAHSAQVACDAAALALPRVAVSPRLSVSKMRKAVGHFVLVEEDISAAASDMRAVLSNGGGLLAGFTLAQDAKTLLSAAQRHHDAAFALMTAEVARLGISGITPTPQ